MFEFSSILLELNLILDFYRERGLPEPTYQIYPDRTVFSWKGVASTESRGDLLSKLHKMFPPALLRSGNVPWIENLVKQLLQRNEMVTTAESCTGGRIGALLTEVPGSSRIYWGGFITYSNDAKVRLLGVPEHVLLEKGAVSRETVILMAQGATSLGKTQWAIAVSGIAGPTGGTAEKPIGTVYIALTGPNRYLRVEKIFFKGTRHEIRKKAALLSLLLLESAVCKEFDIDIEGLNVYI